MFVTVIAVIAFFAIRSTEAIRFRENLPPDIISSHLLAHFNISEVVRLGSLNGKWSLAVDFYTSHLIRKDLSHFSKIAQARFLLTSDQDIARLFRSRSNKTKEMFWKNLFDGLTQLEVDYMADVISQCSGDKNIMSLLLSRSHVADKQATHDAATSSQKALDFDTWVEQMIRENQTLTKTNIELLLQSRFSLGQSFSGFIACENWDLTLLKTLLDYGLDPNMQDDEYGSLLIASSRYRFLEGSQLLLEYGADPNLVVKNSTALSHAATKCYVSHVSLLLSNNADPNTRDVFNSTPLIDAITAGCIDAVKKLLANGANSNIVDGQGRTPLVVATNLRQLNLMKLLLRNNAQIRPLNDCLTILAYIMQQRDWGFARFLLIFSNVAVNLPHHCHSHSSPLHIATQESKTNTVDILLRKGAFVNVLDEKCKTPLHIASEKGFIHIVNLILRTNAYIEARTCLKVDFSHQQRNPINSPERCHPHQTGLLTPLMVSLLNGHTEVAHILIQNGASLFKRAQNGCTAVEISRWHSRSKAYVDEFLKLLDLE